MKKRGLALLLTLAMIFSMFPMNVFATEFSDMTNDWSTKALENAVANGLLKGDNGKIMPNESLTRAQMATIVNRAFGTLEKSSIDGFTDVEKGAWYYDEMSKAVQMKTFIGSGDKLNPDSYITREEAFVALARAFKLSGTNANILDKFSDKNSISDWAKDSVASLVAAGYIAGTNDGRINPKQNITRAEFAQMMDNLIKNYINIEGTYTTDYSGNLMINSPNVTLRGLTVTGDLIIGDGVGNGNVTLDGITVTGRVLVRGGGENSIKITGNSNIQNIIIARVDGKVRVYAEDGSEIGEVIVDGNDDVIIEGNFGTISLIASDVTVTATNANIGSASIEGINSYIIIGKTSTVNTINVNADKSKVQVLGNVTDIIVSNQAQNTEINVASGAKVENITVNGQGVTIKGEGAVKKVTANANNVVVTIPNTSVTAGQGTTGVKAGEITVEPGKTEIVPSETPAVGGGGSSGGSGGDNPPAEVAVESVSVTGEGGVTTITTQNGTLQMVATVTPDSASNKAVTWDFDDNDTDTGFATINTETGLLTAKGNGTVTVRATSVSTPLVSGTAVITISGQEEVPKSTATITLEGETDHSNTKYGNTLTLGEDLKVTGILKYHETDPTGMGFAAYDKHFMVFTIKDLPASGAEVTIKGLANKEVTSTTYTLKDEDVVIWGVEANENIEIIVNYGEGFAPMVYTLDLSGVVLAEKEVPVNAITLDPKTGTAKVAQGASLEESAVTLSSNYDTTGLKTFISLKKDNEAVKFNTIFDVFKLATKVGEAAVAGPYDMVGDYDSFQYGPLTGYAVTAGVNQLTTTTGKVKTSAPVGTYTITTEIKVGDTTVASATYTLEVEAAAPIIAANFADSDVTIAYPEGQEGIYKSGASYTDGIFSFTGSYTIHSDSVSNSTSVLVTFKAPEGATSAKFISSDGKTVLKDYTNIEDGACKAWITLGIGDNPETYTAPAFEFYKDGELIAIRTFTSDGLAITKTITSVAMIGTTQYNTLKEAVAAVQSDQTVMLLANASGDGIQVPSGTNFTLDLGGYTYTVDGKLVGSAGTETQGFQLLRDSTITIKNGTLTTTKAKMLIQNYSNLTLDNVDLIGVDATLYVLSNNNGTTTLTNGTTITAVSDNVAFDVYYWPKGGYTSVSVEILTTDVVIKGAVEYASDGSEDFEKNAELIIPSGYKLDAPTGYKWVAQDDKQVLKVDETLATLEAVNAYLTPEKYVYAEAPGVLEKYLTTLGLQVGAESEYAKLQTENYNRKTAVFLDLNNNKPEKGYDLATLTTYFDQMVATRLVTQASMDKVNDAANVEALGGIAYVTMLLNQFEAVTYGSHSGIAVSEKIGILKDLVDRYDALGKDGKVAVLAKVIEKKPEGGFARSQATTDALAAALTEVEAAIDARLKITKVSVNDVKEYKSSASDNVFRILSYSALIDLDAKKEGKKVSDTTSIKIELYKGDRLLGWQTFMEAGYIKYPNATGLSGDIDVAGDYRATSWDHAWTGGITDIPNKAIATIQYTDGTATAELELEFNEAETKIFFAAEAVHALFEDVFAETLVLAADVTQNDINAAQTLINEVTLKPDENKTVLGDLITQAQALYDAENPVAPTVTFKFVSGFDSFKAAEENSFSIKVTATNIGDTTRVKYKATFKKGDTAVARQEISYEEGKDTGNWKTFTTDVSGVAYFGPANGFTMVELDLSQGVETGLKATITEANSYTLMVELINAEDSSTIGEAGTKTFTVAE